MGCSNPAGAVMRKLGLALAVLLALCACGKKDKPAEAEKEAGEGLTLKDEEIKSLGITVQTATPAQFRGRIEGYGVVTPLDAIAQADSEFLTAQAAAGQSAAAARVCCPPAVPHVRTRTTGAGAPAVAEPRATGRQNWRWSGRTS